MKTIYTGIGVASIISALLIGGALLNPADAQISITKNDDGYQTVETVPFTIETIAEITVSEKYTLNDTISLLGGAQSAFDAGCDSVTGSLVVRLNQAQVLRDTIQTEVDKLPTRLEREVELEL